MGNTTGLAEEALAPDGIDEMTLRRLAAAWPQRATVRGGFDLGEISAHAPEVPDYPAHFLPFAEHPDFLSASDRQRQDVLTMAWLVYNERVITAEEYVANPVFAKLAHGDYPGTRHNFAVAEAVQQAHIDETWHTYMHMLALKRTRDLRALADEPDYPHTVTYRAMLAAQAETAHDWERDLIMFVWAAVAEISVNAYLELLSRNTDIQPMHALVTRLHARDESAHGPVMIEVGKQVYAHLDAEQRRAFAVAVPKALRAFVSQDYAVWPEILRYAGFRNGAGIVEDCKRVPGNSLLVRDFSGVERMIREMGLAVDLSAVRES